MVTALPNYPERTILPRHHGTRSLTERRGAVTVHRSWLRVRPDERFIDKALYELSFTTFSAPTSRGGCDAPTFCCASYRV